MTKINRDMTNRRKKVQGSNPANPKDEEFSPADSKKMG
jgi:hypothetical protein